MLDANRDFAIQLAIESELRQAAPDAALWLCFADDGETDLAKEAWYVVAAARTYFSGYSPRLRMESDGTLRQVQLTTPSFAFAPCAGRDSSMLQPP